MKKTKQELLTQAAIRLTFGLKLKALRKKAKLTLRELAAASGTWNPEISAIEHGRRNCCPTTAVKLANVLFDQDTKSERREFLFAAAYGEAPV